MPKNGLITSPTQALGKIILNLSDNTFGEILLGLSDNAWEGHLEFTKSAIAASSDSVLMGLWQVFEPSQPIKFHRDICFELFCRGLLPEQANPAA